MIRKKGLHCGKKRPHRPGDIVHKGKCIVEPASALKPERGNLVLTRRRPPGQRICLPFFYTMLSVVPYCSTAWRRTVSILCRLEREYVHVGDHSFANKTDVLQIVEFVAKPAWAYAAIRFLTIWLSIQKLAFVRTAER